LSTFVISVHAGGTGGILVLSSLLVRRTKNLTKMQPAWMRWQWNNL